MFWCWRFVVSNGVETFQRFWCLWFISTAEAYGGIIAGCVDGGRDKADAVCRQTTCNHGNWIEGVFSDAFTLLQKIQSPEYRLVYQYILLRSRVQYLCYWGPCLCPCFFLCYLLPLGLYWIASLSGFLASGVFMTIKFQILDVIISSSEEAYHHKFSIWGTWLLWECTSFTWF